jgi:hypothetical protein
MKNSIKGTMFKFGFILFLMMLSISGKAQTRYTMSMTASAPTDRTIDVTLSITANSAGGERFGGYQAGINFNTAIINGGTISAAYVPNSKSSPALDAMVIPTPGVATPGHIRISLQAIAGASAVDMTQGTTLILGTYKITNTVAWASSTNASMWLQNVTASGRTNSSVNGYPFGQSTGAVAISTTAPVAGALALGYTQAAPLSLLLNSNVCATSASQTASTSVTCFGGSDGSSTITLSPVPTASSITYTVDGGSSQSATLVAGAFTVAGLTAGTHTVVISNTGCSNVTASSVSVGSPSQLTNSVTETACDTFTWSVNGQTYTQSGIYTGTSTNGSGCSVEETLNLTINQSVVYYADADGDGYGNSSVTTNNCTQPIGYVTNNTDCNDAVAAVNPGQTEILYNGVDDNCDGQLDEGFQLTTTLQSVSCGTTLPSMGSLIYANINYSASGYRFKVVNNATGATQIINRSFHWFALNMLADYQYATTYTISVELQKAGIWLGYYGSTCTVSTPAVLSPLGSLQVNPSQCGATLPSIGTVIATTPLSGATGYRFRVTDVTAGATGTNLIQVKDRSYHWFTLPMLSRFNYGSTYLVEVAVKTTAGYSAYGSACTVITPAAPTLVNCGAIVPTASSLVYTSSLNAVSQYRFQVTKVSDQSAVTFDTNKFWFSFRSNVSGYTPNAAYSVRVAVMTAGTWSPFGDACEITSPAASSRTDESSAQDFDALAYPNPFTDSFKLNVTTANDENVEYKVYDMLGKLIETKQVSETDVNMQELGTNYPAGVYNIIVTQGEVSKTLRVIKR